jgi:hypothetical protein
MKRIGLLMVLALVAVGSAGAKDSVEATILSAIPKHATPRSRLHVEWRLAELDSGRAFGAGGVFIRLIGAHGVTSTADAAESQPGRFAANVVVPAGGIHQIRIGLHGFASTPQGTKHADAFFRIVNNPLGDVWTPLRRPLRVPTLGPDRACAVTGLAKNFNFARYGVARGVGPGPAYPIGWRDGTIAITWHRNDVDATLWGVAKVLWFVRPSYHGPVLVRGVGLDSSYKVRVDRGRIPPAELRLPEGTKDRPSYVRIRKSGCYAFQIDGWTFSRSIVFRAAGG